jgi:hypothetical protein
VSVVSSCSEAKASVTTNAFWSCASAGSPTTIPTPSARVVSSVIVASRSGVATGSAPSPFALTLRNSVSVLTYSGTIVTEPDSRSVR